MAEWKQFCLSFFYGNRFKFFSFFLVDVLEKFDCLTLKDVASESKVCCHQSLINSEEKETDSGKRNISNQRNRNFFTSITVFLKFETS